MKIVLKNTSISFKTYEIQTKEVVYSSNPSGVAPIIVGLKAGFTYQFTADKSGLYMSFWEDYAKTKQLLSIKGESNWSFTPNKDIPIMYVQRDSGPTEKLKVTTIIEGSDFMDVVESNIRTFTRSFKQYEKTPFSDMTFESGKTYKINTKGTVNFYIPENIQIGTSNSVGNYAVIYFSNNVSTLYVENYSSDFNEITISELTL